MPKTIPTSLSRKQAVAEIEVTSDCRTTTFAEVSLRLGELEAPIEVTGIARCAPHDTFDPMTGTCLSLVRALRALANDFEQEIPLEDRDVDPRDRASAKAIEQLNRERAHWKDAYDRLSEKVGYPADGHDPDSNLLRHAQQEMSKAGLYDADADYGGMLAQAVEDLVRLFAAQGHSGGSAFMVRELFTKLIDFEPLTPLTDDPAEWNKITEEMAGEPDLYQSRRRPDAFSNDGGKTYRLTSDYDTVYTSEPHQASDPGEVADAEPV